MHEIIVSPFLDTFLAVSPGRRSAVKLPRGKYDQLRSAWQRESCPDWLSDAAMRSWGINIAERPLRDIGILREPALLGYGRASYELNMGCNYDCKHCYLGLKQFSGLDWPAREKILNIMKEAGVLWLELTGGEPTIDKLFQETYSRAFDLGMMTEILTNGSRLHNPAILDLLTTRPPHRVTLSVYGATEASYDGLTQRRGSYKSFMKGLNAAHEAGISLDLSIVVTTDNAHEVDAMHAMAEDLGIEYRDYHNMSPTIYGGAESLPSQSMPHLTRPKPFTGCDAGHTSFHVDPHGLASICKIGREPNIKLTVEGIEGLHRLGGIADGLLQRQGGCAGCALSGTCGTCMPLAAKYREAKAPLDRYCQHKERR